LEVVAIKTEAKKNPEAYSSVCRKLPKLCPRLVPSPLWGLSLAKIARMEPRIAFVMSDDYPALVEKISAYWMSLDRSGVCEVCGGEGSEIDEYWLYYVFTEKGKPVPGTSRMIRKSFRGIAYLKDLRLLCSKCHIAKHQGYPLTHGRESEALEWLQKVNRISSVDEVKRLVDQAFNIYHQLSDIEKWSIRIGRLTSLVRLLPNRFRDAKHFEQLFVQKSGGKWIAKVPNAMYEKIFRRVLESLEKTGLAYQAKILCEKDSIVDDYPPIIVYAPTSFSPGYISSLAKVLKTVLNEFGLTGKIHYKPDIFTSKAIYSEKGRKVSIYSYSY